MRISLGTAITNFNYPLSLSVDPIAALFANGEEGAWYDPSDLTTLYQDAAGTTPVTGTGQPVGLMLDKSKGLTLGSELYDTDTSSWSRGFFSVDGTISSAGTAITITQGAGDTPGFRWVQPITCVVGRSYKINAGLISISSGSTTALVAISSNSAGTGVTSATSINNTQVPSSKFVVATATTMYIVLSLSSGTTGDSATFDNISIRELPGNHATQSTPTARPTLQVTGTTPATLGSELSSYTGGVFNGSATGATLIATATAGVAYRVSYEVLSGTATTVLITPTGGSSVASPASVGTHEVVVYGAGGSLRFGYTNAVNLSVGPVSVKEVLTWADPKYYLDFDGGDDWLRTTFSANQAQPNTIAAAFKFDQGNRLEFLADGVGSARNTLYKVSTQLALFAGLGITDPTAAGTSERVVLGHLNTTSSDMRLDGSSVITGSVGNNQWGGITLGATSSGSSWLDGRIYGFVGVNRTLTAGEIDDVESYLATKSGVTLP